MAHWNEERDRRWVEMMRSARNEPELEKAADDFERTGDLVYFSRYIELLRERVPPPINPL